MGKRVDVMLRDAAELRQVLKADPFPDAHPSRVAVAFCSAPVLNRSSTPSSSCERADRRRPSGVLRALSRWHGPIEAEVPEGCCHRAQHQHRNEAGRDGRRGGGVAATPRKDTLIRVANLRPGIRRRPTAGMPAGPRAHHARLRQQLERALPLVGEEREQHVDREDLQEHRQLAHDRLAKRDARAGFAHDAQAQQVLARASRRTGARRRSCTTRTGSCRRRWPASEHERQEPLGRHAAARPARTATSTQQRRSGVDELCASARRAERRRPPAAPRTGTTRRASRGSPSCRSTSSSGLAVRRAAPRCGRAARCAICARRGVARGRWPRTPSDVVVCGRHRSSCAPDAAASPSPSRTSSTRCVSRSSSSRPASVSR